MTTLAELRQANLKEQKEHQPEPTPASEPPRSQTAEPAAAMEVPVAPPSTPAQPSVASPMLVISQEAAPAPTAEEMEGAAFLARIRQALSHKMLHPTGSKATVDMSPALFHRAKRYCMEHGNVTLRQVFLDLLTAYLEEEGY